MHHTAQTTFDFPPSTRTLALYDHRVELMGGEHQTIPLVDVAQSLTDLVENHAPRRPAPLYMGPAANPYDRVAGLYGAAHRLWLTSSGERAERRLLSYLGDVLGSGDSVLEVGAGTGRLTRRIQALQPAAVITALDVSTAMLSRAPSTVARILGSVIALPLADCSYDVVVAGWVIETTTDATLALAECARVLRPGGHLVCCHATQPDRRLSQATSAPTRYFTRRWFGARFLDASHRSLPPSLELARHFRTRRQLAATLLARKRP